MSLDFYLMETKRVVVFDKNITHNCGSHASALGIYKHLWRHEELKITQAIELISPLYTALKEIQANPTKYESCDPVSGWGTVESFTEFLKKVLQACLEHPYAEIEVSR